MRRYHFVLQHDHFPAVIEFNVEAENAEKAVRQAGELVMSCDPSRILADDGTEIILSFKALPSRGDIAEGDEEEEE